MLTARFQKNKKKSLTWQTLSDGSRGNWKRILEANKQCQIYEYLILLLSACLGVCVCVFRPRRPALSICSVTTHAAHLSDRPQPLPEWSGAIGQPAQGGVGVGSGDKTHPSAMTAHGLRGVPRVCLIPAHTASSSCVPATPQEEYSIFMTNHSSLFVSNRGKKTRTSKIFSRKTPSTLSIYLLLAIYS